MRRREKVGEKEVATRQDDHNVWSRDNRYEDTHGAKQTEQDTVSKSHGSYAGVWVRVCPA